MATLTRSEAERRASGLAVSDYRIALDLPEAGGTFTCTTTIRFSATLSDSFVDVRPERLLSATLDGAALDVAAFADGRLPLSGLGGPHELVVEAVMAYSHDGEGLHHFVDPADGATYLCATSAVDNAPRWFACFDQPDLKARVELVVDCPPAWTVIGNGTATSDAPGRWRLAPTERISTYLVTLVAGPWHVVTGAHDGIGLGLSVRASLAAELDRDAPELLQLTADSLDAFHELFDVRYPFGRYHQAFVPEFNWGAMENPGCVTFRDQMIFRSRPTEVELTGRATTIVHEMAHMWFGDLVTMRWWDDLWLNESFAEYLSHRVGAQITAIPVWEDFAAGRKSWGYDADRRATTHPVAGNGAPDTRAALDDFDGISYAKGASVLRQLAAWLGDRMFLDGLRAHVRDHAWGNATFADLLGSWAAAAGPDTPGPDDLAQWAQQWLRTAGVDTLTVAAHDAPTLTRGVPLFGPPAQRPHALSVAAVPSGASVDVVVDTDVVTVALPGVRADDIVVPNAHDESWATVRLDPSHWERLPDVLPRTADPAVRVVLWNALRTALADGLVAPALAVRTVVAGVPDEIDLVAEQVLRWITAALPRYVAPGSDRDDARRALAVAARARLTAAPSGGGAQVTAARAWIALTDDLDTLRSWSTGADVPAGLVVDDELRWAVLARRSAAGDLSPAAIDDAAAADRTASGAVHAARCRVLRPDPAAKATAWDTLLDPASGRSQYELVATAGAVWEAGQEDLGAPYAARWFTDMPATSAFRSGWSLTGVAEACFPHLAVDATTLAAAGATAARTDVAPGLRRTASDGADELRRAIAVRTAAVDPD